MHTTTATEIYVSRRRQKRGDLDRAQHEPTEAEIAEQDLADAKGRLAAAVRALVDRQVELVAGAERETLSLYEQVVELLGGFAVLGSRGGRTASTPVWIDGLSLLDDMDKSLRDWWTGDADRVSALRGLSEWQWTNADTDRVTGMAADIEGWVTRIQTLLDPRFTQVRRACPACSTRHIYRRNSYGDSVRTATLQIDADGVRCLSCAASWTYAQSEFLRRLLEAEDKKEDAYADA